MINNAISSSSLIVMSRSRQVLKATGSLEGLREKRQKQAS